MNKEELIKSLFKIKALKFEESHRFGRTSPYDIDFRGVSSDPTLMTLLGHVMTRSVILNLPVSPTVICGMTHGGVTIANAIGDSVFVSMCHTRKEPAVRKEIAAEFKERKRNGEFLEIHIPGIEKTIEILEKQNGLKRHSLTSCVDGIIKDGDKVLLVDDVVALGGNFLDLAQMLRSEWISRNIKAEIIEAAVVVDKDEGGKEILKRAGIPLYSAFSITKVVRLLANQKLISKEKCEQVIAFAAAQRVAAGLERHTRNKVT